MTEPTHIIRFWPKGPGELIPHPCYFEPYADGIDVLYDANTKEVLCYFDIERKTYSLEDDGIGFWISKILIQDTIKKMQNEMYRAVFARKIMPTSVQTSGQPTKKTKRKPQKSDTQQPLF